MCGLQVDVEDQQVKLLIRGDRDDVWSKEYLCPKGTTVAREHAGVNSNLLAPTHFYDTLSNNHAVNGIPVEVVPA
jgi:hypothetical protein